MSSDDSVFAGVELSSGRKPVTFAALDDDLNIKSLEKLGVSEALACLKEYENIALAIHMPTRGQEIYTDLKTRLVQMGFKPYARKTTPKQWFETNGQDCFRALIGQNLLSRRTFEGRLQRALILYEQGLQIIDPMEIFEEITRYKLIQGILPLEAVHSSKELDALAAGYLAWMAVNRPGQIVAQGQFLLPAQE